MKISQIIKYSANVFKWLRNIVISNNNVLWLIKHFFYWPFVDFFFGINNAAVNILTHESWTASYSIYSKLLLQRVFKLIHTLNKALLFWKAFPIPPSIWWLKNSSSLIFFFFPITSEVQLFNVYKCSFLIFVN